MRWEIKGSPRVKIHQKALELAFRLIEYKGKTGKNQDRDFDSERKNRADWRYLDLILVTDDSVLLEFDPKVYIAKRNFKK